MVSILEFMHKSQGKVYAGELREGENENCPDFIDALCQAEQNTGFEERILPRYLAAPAILRDSRYISREREEIADCALLIGNWELKKVSRVAGRPVGPSKEDGGKEGKPFNCGLRISDCRFKISPARLRIADCLAT